MGVASFRPRFARRTPSVRLLSGLGLFMIAKSQIEAQCREYAAARALIDSLPDALERQIGLASLRLEATATYRQLATTGVIAYSDALSPLRDYVSALSGGERVEKVVGTVDQYGAKQATALASAAFSGVLTGMWAPSAIDRWDFKLHRSLHQLVGRCGAVPCWGCGGWRDTGHRHLQSTGARVEGRSERSAR